MGIDVLTLSKSKKYTNMVALGLSSAVVDDTAKTITFTLAADGSQHTIHFDQPSDGISVTGISDKGNGKFTLLFSDGSESDEIQTVKGEKGLKGDPGEKGDDGFSPTITENADNTDKIYKLDITTADSTFTTPNLKGADGQGGGTADVPIEKIKVNGELQTPVNKVVDITVPSIEGLTKDADLATVAKSGSYEDLINKPTIPDITGLATETYVDNKVADYTKTSDLADVATTGSYNDLVDKPTIPSLDGYAKTSEIPTRVSELENDSNYLSSIPEEYVTETELEAKGYLTEHQDISGKVDKVEGKSLISDTEIARIASVDNYDDTAIKAEIAKKADATAIPSKVSVLENDSKYQTESDVTTTLTDYATKTYVGEQITNAEHLKREIVTVLPSDTEASDNIIYMLKVESATGNDKYQEYMKIDGTVQMVGDTSVDLTDYAKTVDIPTTVSELTDSADYAKTADVNNSISTLQTDKADASDLTAHTDDADIHVTAENKATWNTVSDKVDKEDGKGLSANDYTNEEKALVGTIEDKINKTSIVTALDDTVTDEQVASALLAKTELDKISSAQKEAVAKVNESLACNASKNMLLVNVGTISGVTITSKDKSTALLNGTNTSNVGVFATADVIPSGEYHLKVSNRLGALYVWDSTHSKTIIEIDNTECNFTLTEPVKLTVGFSIGNGCSFTNFEVSGQLEKGTVATDFVPYNGKSNLELTNDVVSLKNDLNTLEFGDIAGGRNLWSLKSSYTTTINAWALDRIEMSLKAGTYRLSCSNNTSAEFVFTNNTNTDVDAVHINPNATFTLSKDTKYVYLWINTGTVSDIQIEKGSTTTEYEPYIPSVKMLADEVYKQNESLEDYGLLNKFDGDFYQGFYDTNGTEGNPTQNNITVTNKNHINVSDGDIINFKYIGKTTTFVFAQFYKNDGTNNGIITIENGRKIDSMFTVPKNSKTMHINIQNSDGITPNDVSSLYISVNNEIAELKNDLGKNVSNIKKWTGGGTNFLQTTISDTVLLAKDLSATSTIPHTVLVTFQMAGYVLVYLVVFGSKSNFCQYTQVFSMTSDTSHAFTVKYFSFDSTERVLKATVGTEQKYINYRVTFLSGLYSNIEYI